MVQVRGMGPPSTSEVAMVEADVVRQMRQLLAAGWGLKRVAKEIGVSRNTVRRYLRGGVAAEGQLRPRSRRLDAAGATLAVQLFEDEAQGNAVVLSKLLEERGILVGVRTVQRAVEQTRREVEVNLLASVRYETGPGRQMQIDFGEKWVEITGELVKVHLLAAVLGYSRRIYVQAFLRERQDDWREGIAQAFLHFGGVTAEILGDNAKALVIDRDRATGTVRFHPGYLAFCKDWGVTPKACGPYRARTKGKVESGVKYVKRNALAGRRFESFAELQSYLVRWMVEADQRIHGTTGEAPLVRFEREEKAALCPLPLRPLVARERRLARKVANDALVDVDTVRYSVPHRLVKQTVEVLVGDAKVSIFHDGKRVAEHARSFEPRSRITEASHYDGLWRRPYSPSDPRGPEPERLLEQLGRSLSEYAELCGEVA